MHFSVIITTYNRANLVSTAIKSVLKQSFQDFELIIVNDASIDNTEEVVHSFQDTRIKYIRNKENLHKGGARNEGIKMAIGQYITFLDDDDHYLPSHLENIAKRIKKEGQPVAVFYTNVVKTNGKTSQIIKTGPIPKDQDPVSFVFQPWTPIGAPQATIHREILTRFNFNTQIRIGQDTELFMRIAANFPLFYLDSDTFIALVHSENSGALKYNAGKDRLEGYSYIFENEELSKHIPKSLKNYMISYCYRRMSDHYEFIGDRKKTFKSAVKALYYAPGKDFKINTVHILYNFPLIGGLFRSMRELTR